MINIVRTSLHRAITTPLGDRFLPVRLPKDLARRMNVMLGEPLCSKSELDRRRAGRAKLEELKQTGGKATTSAAKAAPTVQAPVMVYFEKDRNARMLGRIKEALDAKSITYTVLDVAGDTVTRDFVLREAKCKDDDLPVVFIAGSPVGGYNDLVDWDVSGRLAKALAGE
jgi:glutaredoxin